jgi:hypothetical protein
MTWHVDVFAVGVINLKEPSLNAWVNMGLRTESPRPQMKRGRTTIAAERKIRLVEQYWVKRRGSC